MTADRLDAASIEPLLRGSFGRPLRAHDVIGSTNADALEWAATGAPEGAVVVAEHQTAGRGRWGRGWSSEPGRLLQFSVVLRPEIPPSDAGVITTSVGVAVARSIESVTSLEPKIKWPNDITISQRKLAGILVESRGREAIDVAVVGIGVNVNWAGDEMPEEIASTATSLSEELGRPFPRAELLASILAELETVFAWGTTPNARTRLIAEATDRSEVLGRGVTVTGADGSTREGIARRLTETGALELETPSGTEEIHVGEVTRLRAQG